MKRDKSRGERPSQKVKALFESDKHVAALRELGGDGSAPPLEVADRRERIRRALDAVEGAKRSEDGVLFPRFLATKAGVEQPQITQFVRRLAKAIYRPLAAAQHEFQAKSRSAFLTEAAAVRKRSFEELQSTASMLQVFLHDLVAASCLAKRRKRQEFAVDPEVHVQEIVRKLEFASEKDVFSAPHELEDPLRHEALTAFLKTRPYREIGEKLQEFFWGAAVNMAQQFDEACRRGVDQHIFGLASFDPEARTAQFHFFEQHEEAYGSWTCKRHDHELINAERRRVAEADADGFAVPRFVTAVVERNPWIEPLLSIVDGELVNEETELVRSPTAPPPPPPPRPAIPASPAAAPARPLPRRNNVQRFRVSYDPALVMGPYAAIGWDDGSLREADRMTSALSNRPALIGVLKGVFRRGLQLMNALAVLGTVGMLLAFVWISVGPVSAFGWPLDSKGAAFWSLGAVWGCQRVVSRLSGWASRTEGG